MASSRPSQTVSDETLTRWRERLIALRRELAEPASPEQAWFRRLQFAILAYLCKRYGHMNVPPLGRAGDEPSGSVATGLPLPLLGAPPATPAPSRSAMLLSRQSAEKIRSRVSSLIAENRERIEAIAAEQAKERARERAIAEEWTRRIRAEWLKSLPRRRLRKGLAKALLDDARADLANALWAVTYDEALGIGNEVVMTEDELLAILNEQPEPPEALPSA